MRLAAPAMLLLGLFCLESHAQSLPELARQERERRLEVRPGRVFTNENIRAPQVGGTAVPFAPRETVAEPEQASGSMDATGRTEQQWRDLFGEARGELSRAEQRLTLAQQELNDLNYRLLTESSLYNREYQLQPEINAKREELDQAEVYREQAAQALRQLQQELRRAGAPPGWGRP